MQDGRDCDGGSAALSADHIARLAAGAAAPDQPHDLLSAIDEVARQAMTPSLFTAMAFDEAAMAVERIYTSNAAAYPVGGRKPKGDTAWGRHVLMERRAYIGEGEAAIRDAFSDHELILGLGLRAVINIPVVFAGECLGTLNFLWRQSEVRRADVALARLLALIAAAGLRPPRGQPARSSAGRGPLGDQMEP
jgi:GAF domain-containing protein